MATKFHSLKSDLPKVIAVWVPGDMEAAKAFIKERGWKTVTIQPPKDSKKVGHWVFRCKTLPEEYSRISLFTDDFHKTVVVTFGWGHGARKYTVTRAVAKCFGNDENRCRKEHQHQPTEAYV